MFFLIKTLIFQVCNWDVYLKLEAADMCALSQRKQDLITKQSVDLSSPDSDHKDDTECPIYAGNNDANSEVDTAESTMDKTDSTSPAEMKERASHFQKYGVDWFTVTVLSTSASIQTETVPQSMFSKTDVFYCCVQCGKVFWEGTHFERVCQQFSHVLNVDSDSATVYDRVKENWA